MTPRILTLGNTVVDVVAAVPALPARGADLLASGGAEAGGSGFHAVAAARDAGLRAAFAGRIGTGPFGELLRAALGALGAEVLLPAVPDRDSGAVVTLLEPDGERTFVTLRGAETADPLLSRLAVTPDDLVHVSGYGLLERERAEAIAAFVAELPDPVRVLYDPGPLGDRVDPRALQRLLERADWWSGTGAEAARATGERDPLGAAARLARTARTGAVVRLGAAGCLLALPGTEPIALSAPSVLNGNTNGAGDRHAGAFLAALAAGRTPLAAAEAAGAAAARFVARPRPSAPTAASLFRSPPRVAGGPAPGHGVPGENS